MIYFTSDLHFGHANIIKSCKRPFDSVAQMNEQLIARWNGTVKPDDTVYCLGDWVFKGSQETALNLVRQLNGHITLIAGNHDDRYRKAYQQFAITVLDYKELKYDGELYVLCHYPFDSWRNAGHGSFHLHGHCHGTVKPGYYQRRIDVGVDDFDFRPVSIEALRTKLAARDIRKKHDENDWR